MPQFQEIAKLIRYLTLVSTNKAGSGHATSSLSSVELMTALYFGGYLQYDTKNPHSESNDQVIFSKGHAAPLLYSLFYVAGLIPYPELMTLRKFNSRLEGHPSHKFPFHPFPTGSLGMGLSLGVGLGLSYKHLKRIDNKIFVLLGDGEMAEGQIYEALELADHYQLNNLIGIVDVNNKGQTGPTMVGTAEIYRKRVENFGWTALVIDGHNFSEIEAALDQALHNSQPTLIIAQTIKGKGVSFLENREGKHGKALSNQELDQALSEIGPVDLNLRAEIKQTNPFREPNINRIQARPNYAHQLTPTSVRNGVGRALIDLGETYEELVVLDGDLANSTNVELFAKRFPERFFQMYIAEQNMISSAQGLAFTGQIPVVSTYGSFLTRAYDQIRMASLAQSNIKLYGSHGGVSLGADGFSQMGLNDIAMMRSLDQSVVLYPCDFVSAYKLTKQMVTSRGLTYLRGTRDECPTIYNEADVFEIGSCHVLKSSPLDQVTIIGAGITVHEALRAYNQLKEQGVFTRIIDLYCIKPLDKHTLLIAANQTKALITVEDHYPEGGLGEAVSSALSATSAQVHHLAVTKTPMSGSKEQLLEYEEINATAIVAKVKEILKII